MTMPPGIPAPGPGQPGPIIVDTGNALLAQTPAQLTTGVMQTPGGQLSLLTIRTPSTTLTVMLDGKDLKTWAKLLNSMASNASGNGLITGQLGPIKPQ